MGSQCSVWIDVEDIFEYFQHNSRPSGIQRLVFEILRVIETRAERRDPAMRIRLVRRAGTGGGAPDGAAPFAAVPFEQLAGLFEGGPGADPEPDAEVPSPVQTVPPVRASLPRRLRRSVIRRLETVPPEIGAPILSIAVNQLNVVRLTRRYLRQRLGRRRTAPVASPFGAPPAGTPLAGTPAVETGTGAPAAGPADERHPDAPAPGDLFLILGAAWSERGFGERLSELRARYGVEPILLVYDLIPALRPEWCARSLILDFRHWLDSTLPQCRRLLAISQATAHSVETYARENGLELAAPVRTIPIGSGFGPERSSGRRVPGLRSPGPRSPGLPAPGSYVLFVSTIEARKNHMLAFLVWQRLLAELPRQSVPTLVFAGREGWLVADLLQQIENTDWLRGKLRLLRDPTDGELAQLYDGCLFTLFPSLFEGWGLPVTESLMNGAPCIASNATSIPEAGGTLTRYFDPENVDDAFRVVRDALADPDGIERWRREVRDGFEPVPWERTADAILDACEQARPDRSG